MTAKSTMEELRELNVRRQREAQHADQQDAPAPAPENGDSDDKEIDKMIILSNEHINDNANDNSRAQTDELSRDYANTHLSTPTHVDRNPSVIEATTDDKGPPSAARELAPRPPAKGKGRTGQKTSPSATDRLFAQTAREPIMRLNIELTESMHTQLKQYCVLHKVPIRLLITALIEDFFAKEGEGQ